MKQNGVKSSPTHQPRDAGLSGNVGSRPNRFISSSREHKFHCLFVYLRRPGFNTLSPSYCQQKNRRFCWCQQGEMQH